jgi:hypothetical protein
MAEALGSGEATRTQPAPAAASGAPAGAAAADSGKLHGSRSAAEGLPGLGDQLSGELLLVAAQDGHVYVCSWGTPGEPLMHWEGDLG